MATRTRQGEEGESPGEALGRARGRRKDGRFYIYIGRSTRIHTKGRGHGRVRGHQKLALAPPPLDDPPPKSLPPPPPPLLLSPLSPLSPLEVP